MGRQAPDRGYSVDPMAQQCKQDRRRDLGVT
jgi:hypothetical protein